MGVSALYGQIYNAGYNILFLSHSVQTLGKVAKTSGTGCPKQWREYPKLWPETLKIGETMGRMPQDAVGPCLDRCRIGHGSHSGGASYQVRCVGKL